MTQDTYRFAYEEASAELRNILSEFDQLNARKAQMEGIVAALTPLLTDAPVETTAKAAVTEIAEPVPFLMQSVAEVTPQPVIEAVEEVVPEPAYAGEVSSDPFQRRIDNALKHGFGSREARVLPRALNGLLSRA